MSVTTLAQISRAAIMPSRYGRPRVVYTQLSTAIGDAGAGSVTLNLRLGTAALKGLWWRIKSLFPASTGTIAQVCQVQLYSANWSEFLPNGATDWSLYQPSLQLGTGNPGWQTPDPSMPFVPILLGQHQPLIADNLDISAFFATNTLSVLYALKLILEGFDTYEEAYHAPK